MWIAGGDHQGPPRGRKLGWSRQRVHGLAVVMVLSHGIPLNRIRNPERKVTPQLSLSGGFSLGFLDDRNIGIGILPEQRGDPCRRRPISRDLRKRTTLWPVGDAPWVRSDRSA